MALALGLALVKPCACNGLGETMKRTVLGFLGGLVLAGATPAAEPAQVSAIDLLLDWQQYQGKTVTVPDCLINGADLEGAACVVVEKGDVGGNFNLDTTRLDSQARKALFRQCADYGYRLSCMFKVTGVVDGSTGDLWLQLVSVDGFFISSR